MDWNEKDAILDLLYDREKEIGTNGELWDDAVKSLKEEFKNWEDEDAMQDFISEWADRHTEIYTTEVFKWYSLSASRFCWADDAISEFGYDEEGGIVKALQMGIYQCLENFAYSVLNGDKADEGEAKI